MVDAWTTFWFAPLDPLSLGVCRLLVGSMMVYSHLVWGLDLEGFFGPEGWHSVEAMQTFFADDWLPSLWWYVPPEHLRSVHLFCTLPLVLFALGIFTPLSSVLALAITISSSNRAPLANYGMDQFLVMLALYLTIGGSGARFSIDSWWRNRRSPQEQGRTVASSRARLATRLIQVHYCVIYYFAGLSKLQGDAWWTGEAVWMAFANLEYQSIDMTWLARYPWVTQIATHGTVLWELSFPFLVWNRSLRPIVLAVGIAMHAGIGLCMGMITFGLIAIFGYLAFVPPEAMQRVLSALSPRRGRSPRQQETDTSNEGAATDGARLFSAAAGSSGELWLTADPAGSGEMLSPTDECRQCAVDPGDHPAIEPETWFDEPSEDALPIGSSTEQDDADGPLVGICDPGWKNRKFAHYLAARGYRPFVAVTPERLWCACEQHSLAGAVLFVDQLASREYALLLEDLTLSPICQLPMVIVSRRADRLIRAQKLNCPRLRGILLPASCREIRQALEAVLSGTDASPRPASERGESDPACGDPAPDTVEAAADEPPAQPECPSGSTNQEDVQAPSPPYAEKPQ